MTEAITTLTPDQVGAEMIAAIGTTRRSIWEGRVADYKRTHAAMNGHWRGRFDQAEASLVKLTPGTPEYAEAELIVDEAQSAYDVLVNANGEALNALMLTEAPDIAALAYKLAIHRDEQLWDGWGDGAKIAIALAADAERLCNREA